MLYIVTARLAYIVFSGSKFQAYILFFLMFHWSSKKLYSIVRKTKGQIRIHSENLDKTSVSKPKNKCHSTYPDLKDLKVVLEELQQRENQKSNSV